METLISIMEYDISYARFWLPFTVAACCFCIGVQSFRLGFARFHGSNNVVEVDPYSQLAAPKASSEPEFYKLVQLISLHRETVRA